MKALVLPNVDGSLLVAMVIPQKLFDQSIHIGQRRAISEVREPLISDDPIDLVLSFPDNVRVPRHGK